VQSRPESQMGAARNGIYMRKAFGKTLPFQNAKDQVGLLLSRILYWESFSLW
jgi:hypothetical protein